MLYQLTNNCNLNCEHCLNDSGQNNLHADRIITIKVAKFIIENNINVVVVAGGEPFTHPRFFDHMIVLAKLLKKKCQIVIDSNGFFMRDDYVCRSFARLSKKYKWHLQISAIPEFYKDHEETKVLYEKYHDLFYHSMVVDQITVIDYLGRAKGKNFDHLDAFKRSAPTCFNLLSAAKKCDSLKRTINTIELVGNLCKPMVSHAGDLYVGESLECLIFGNIDDPIDKIFKSLKSLWPCGRCGVNGPYVNLLKRKFSLNEPH